MKLKQFALILSAMTFAQATLAAAPLCRSVLRSFTQEQINASIEDFTLLTLRADIAQATGDNSIMTRSLLATKQLKEKELLQSLNISRKELRQLVSARIAILQNRDVKETQTRERSSAKEAVLKKEFTQVKHFEPHFPAGIWKYSLVANGTKLLGSGASMELMSLEDGALKRLFGEVSMILPDAVFTSGRANPELTVTNLHNGAQTKHETFPHRFEMIGASDKQSIVKFNAVLEQAFEYQHVDKNGALLSWVSIPQLKRANLKHVGINSWLLILPSESYVLFNPITKDVTPLNITGDSVSDLGSNKVGIVNENILHTVDLTTGKVFSKDLGDQFTISFSNEKFIWIIKDASTDKDQGELRKLDINTLEEVPGFGIPIGYLIRNSQSNSNLIAIDAGDRPGSRSQINSGIYRKEDLQTPIFNTSEVYADKNIRIQGQLLSEDGNTLVIMGTNNLLSGKKFFVDVWKFK